MATILATLGTSFASAMASLGTVSGLSTLGTLLSVGGTIYGGLSAASNAADEAAQLKVKGDNEFASSQRKAMEQRRQTALVLSRQRAVAAAGGGDATDPTVTAIMGRTEQQGEYNAMIDMYNGSVSRADYYKDAASKKSEGKASFIGSLFDAGSTIYSAAAKKKQMAAGYG